ncbi:hypothetical protein LAZ67_8001701 [Cordylochernes scorpioides]|uniref:Uncharacterized protein n=1 Tax=Cordylochernes scorpioides TaxID=51811 RepID=A0ABY6KQF9_9ARAC|nr:hypothetical protein LAZ67_8001701 [Cordylochernes scorpioides]
MGGPGSSVVNPPSDSQKFVHFPNVRYVVDAAPAEGVLDLSQIDQEGWYYRIHKPPRLRQFALRGTETHSMSTVCLHFLAMIIMVVRSRRLLLITPPLPAPAEMEESVPMTEEERCAPPPPAPRLARPIPPVPHGDTTTPAMATPPPPLSTQMDRALMDKRWEALRDLIHGLNREFELDLEHRF